MIYAFVKEGLIPFLTWESDVTHLIPFLTELPRSVARRCVFNCDTSDIFQAKKLLDGHMCIAGNIPLSTMCVGTPHDVEKYCAKLFEVLKPGGGYLLNPALGIPDEAKPENVHAMIQYARKYGK
jgi:uroporphyrinogen-III decarboxylase